MANAKLARRVWKTTITWTAVWCTSAANLPLPVRAVDYTWTGASPGNLWHDAANWSPGGSPSVPGDTATFDLFSASPVVVNLDAETVTLKAINFGASAGPFELTNGILTLDGGVGSGIFVAGGTASNQTLSVQVRTAGNVSLVNQSLLAQLSFDGGVRGADYLSHIITIDGLGGGRFGGPITDGYGLAATALNVSSSGTWTFSGASNFAGGTTSGAAVLLIGHDRALGTGAITLNGGVLSSDGAAPRNLANDLVIGGDVALGQTGTGGLTFAGAVDLGAATRTLTIDNVRTTLAGPISGGGASLVKSGAGILTLSGANTYTGGTTVNLGTLLLGNDAALGSGALTLGFDTAVAALNGGSFTFNNALVLSGTATLGQTFGNTGSLTFQGLVDLGATTGTLTVNNTTTISGVISGAAGVGLFKSGNGTLILSGVNTYTGESRILSGTLRLAGAGGDVLPDGRRVLVSVGAVLDVNDTSETVGSILGNGSIVLGSGTLTIGAGPLNSVISGVVSGTGDLVKIGATPTLTLSGLNTYTGATILREGRVLAPILAKIGLASSLGAGDAADTASNQASLVFDGGTLTYTGTGTNSDRLFTITPNGGGIENTGRGTLLLTGTPIAFSGSGARTFTLGGTAPGVTALSLTGSSSLAPALGDGAGGPTSFVKTGGGVWQLAGANSYTGSTSILGGTLVVTSLANGGSNSNLGSSAATADNLVIDGGTLRYVGGAAAVINRLFTIGAGGATLDSSHATSGNALRFTAVGAVGQLGSGPRTLTLAGVNTGTNTFALELTDNGFDQTSLLKTGTGNWTISRSGATTGNSYTGTTTVERGTLTLNFGGTVAPLDQLISPGSMLVLSGGTLAVVGKAATVHFQTFNNLTLNAGSSALTATIGSGGEVDINLAGIFRNPGATLDLTLPATGAVITSAANQGSTGILGGYAVVAGADWATVSAGNITSFGGYTDINLGGVIADGPDSNVRINGGTTGNITLGASTTNINTLLQNLATAATVDTTGGVLRFGATGGILLAVGKENLTIGTAPNVGTVTAGGPLDDSSGELILDVAAAAKVLTINSTIADNGFGLLTLTKTGAGVAVLAGNNTYTGGTYLNQGTLRVTNSAALGTGLITVNGASVLASDGAGARQIDNNFTLLGDLQLADSVGTGSLSLTGSFDLTGGTRIITSANNYVALTGALGNGTLVKAGGNTLALLSVNNSQTATYLTAGNLDIRNGAALGFAPLFVSGGALSGTMGFAGPITNDVYVAGNFSLGRSGIVDGIQLAGVVDLVNGVRTITVNQLQQKISGIITNGGLVKSGAADLILTGKNTYVGGTTVARGSLVVAGAQGLGFDVAGNDAAVTPNTANSAAILRLATPDALGDNQILSINPARADAPASLGLGAGFADGTGATIGFNTTGSSLQNIRLANNSSLAAFYLDGIRFGDDLIAKTNAAAPTTPVWFGATPYNGTFTGASLSAGVGGNYRLGGGGGTLIIENAGVLTGANNLIVGSPDATARGLSGAVFIPAAQSFTGNIAVGSGGILSVGSDGALGDPSNAITLTVGTLELRTTGTHGSIDAQYAGRNVTVTGTSTISVAPYGGLQQGVVEIGSLNTTGGNRQINFNVASMSDLRVTGASTFAGSGAPFTVTLVPVINTANSTTFAGPIGDTNGAASVRVAASNINVPLVVLAADNTYGGTTSITRGVLVLANTGAAGNAGSGVTIDPAASTTATLDLRTGASGTSAAPVLFDFGTLTLAGAGASGTRFLNVDRVSGLGSGAVVAFDELHTGTAADLTVTGERGYTLQIQNSTTLGANFSFNIRGTRLDLLGGVTDGAGTFSLTKTGTGVLVLSGTAAYNGTTSVVQGTLIANHDTAGVVDVFGTGNLAFGSNQNSGILVSGVRMIDKVITNGASGGVQVLGGIDAGAKLFSANVVMGRSLTLTAVTGGDVAFAGVISQSSAGQGITIGSTTSGVLPGNGGTPPLGRGTVILDPTTGTGNTFTGALTINSGTLVGQAQAVSGSPFGVNNAIALNDGTLMLRGLALPTADSTTATTGAMSVGGGANLRIYDIAVDGFKTTFTVGSLSRTGTGAVAYIPQTNTGEEVWSITSPTLVNGILAPWVVKAVSDADRSGDFLTVVGGNVSGATYGSVDVDDPVNGNTSIVHSLGGVLSDNRFAYALRLDGDLDLNGNALNIGDLSTAGSFGGLILNDGADLTGGTLNFGLSEGIIYVDDADTSVVSSSITGKGTTSLTKFGAGTLVLSGNNTYRGATIINRGTLRMGAVNAIGGFSNPVGYSAVTIGAAAVLDLNGFETEIGNLTGDFGSQVLLGSTRLTVGRSNAAGTFSGQLVGDANSVLRKNGTGRLILDNTRGDLPSTLGELRVNQGQVRIVVTGTTNGSPYDVGNSLPSTTNIVLRGGTAEFYTSGDNTSSLQTLVAGNNITVSRGNSVLDVNRFNSSDSNKLELFGSLTLDRNEFATVGGNANMPKFVGAVTLTDHTRLNTSSADLTLEGIVSDGGAGYTINKVGGASLILNNAANSWSGGTVLTGGTLLFGTRGADPIYSPGNTFVPSATARAGTGDVILNNGSAIRLNDITNLASQQRVWVVGAGVGSTSMVDVRTDRSLADYHLRALGSGALVLSGGSTGSPLGVFGEAIDLATLGDGTWGLAAGQDTIYTASTLGAGADDAYRFAGSLGGFLIIQERNVLTGSASVTVGRGLLDLGAAAANATALVRLTTDQDYTGTTLVNRTATRGSHGARLEVRGRLASGIIENYGRVELNGAGRFTDEFGFQSNQFIARPGSSLRLDYDFGLSGFLVPGGGESGSNATGFTNKWQDDLPMTLDGSQLDIVNGSAVQTIEQIGGLVYGGGSEILLERRSTNGQVILLINGGLSRIDLGTLAIRTNVDNELGIAVTAPAVGNTQRIVFADPLSAPQRGIVSGGSADGAVINMVAPQFVEMRQMLFVDYNPAGTTGFTLAAMTNVGNATFNSGGANNGTELVNHLTTAVTTVGPGSDVWALKTAVNIAGANPITIRSGGLIAVTASSASLAIGTDLNFSNGSPVEADIWTNIGTGTLSLTGAITANNLTKNGPGRMLLSGNNTNLTGMIQLNGGTVELRGATAAGAVTTLRMHGSYLNNDGSFEMPRLDLRADTTNAASRAFLLDVVVAANVPYAEISSDRFAGTSTNQAITVQNLTVEAGGAAGSVLAFLNGNDFDFTVNGTTTLGLGFTPTPVGINVQNNSSTNRVTFAGLTTGSGMLVKSGNGVLTLADGNNDFFGGLVLNDGTLELVNSTTATDWHFMGLGATVTLNRGTLRMVSNQTNTNFMNGGDLAIHGQVIFQFDRASGSGVIFHQLGSEFATLSTSNSPNIQINSGSNQVTSIWNGRTLINDNPQFLINGPTFQLGNGLNGDSVIGTGRIVKTGNGTLLFNSGAVNDFSGGLDIYYGKVRANTNLDTLGTGAIRLSPGATLDLLLPTNLAGLGITSFAVNATSQTILGLGTNSGTGFTSIAQVNALLQAGAFSGLADQGGLVGGSLNGGNYNFLNDLSAIGNGYWFIGAVVSNTNFTNVTFVPGAENVYRFGGGGATVVFNPTAVRDVLPEGSGPTRLLIGKPYAIYGNGSVVIDSESNNSYSAGTTISRVRDSAGNITISQLNVQGGYTRTPLGTGAVEVYGNLQIEATQGSAVSSSGGNRNLYTFHPGSRLIFDNGTVYNVAGNTQGRWADTVGIALRSSGLEITGDETASVFNSEAVGAVTFEGGSELRSSRRATSFAELLINGRLTRIGFATITLIHDIGKLGTNDLTTTTSDVDRIRVVDTAGLLAPNGMVLPFIVSRSENQFLKYDPAAGFQLVTQGTPLADYVATTATTLDGSVNAKLTDGTAVLSYDGTVAATLAANLDIFALRLQGDINSSADLTASQITIRSGGITNYGASTRTINADLIFGTSASPGEALIHATSATLQINGQLTASNITKFGTGFLTIFQDQPNFNGTWSLNQGGLQILTPGGLGTGAVFLNGWTGNTGQTQTELRLNFNPLSPEELVFTSGKITSYDQNLIRVVSASDRESRIAAIDLKTTTPGDAALAIPGLIRFQIDGGRSLLHTGAMTLFDHYLIQVDATSFGPGATTYLAPDSLDNQGLYDLTKIGDGVLELRDNPAFTGGRTVLVTEGAIRAVSNNAFGGAGSNTSVIVDHGGALEIAVANFTLPAGVTLTMQPGAIERWAVDHARPSGYNLAPGAHLQIFASQSGTATYGLNGGSIMGYLPLDYDEIAIINSVGPGISFNLLADSFLGQPYPAGVQNQSGTINHLYYDMGKANLFNNPLDPRLQGGYLQIWGDITGDFNLTKVGQDVVLIGGTNTYRDTIVREGLLQVGSAGALPSTGRVSLFTDGMLDLNGFDVRIGGLQGNSTVSRIVNGATSINTLTVDDDLDSTYAGRLYGALALTKQGLGTLTLSGTNSYVGSTTLVEGVLAVTTVADDGAASSLGSSSSAAENLVFNGGTLAYVGNIGTTNRLFTVGPGGATIESSNLASLTFSNPGFVAYIGAGPRTITLTGGSNEGNTFRPFIGDAGSDPTSLVKSGTGTWTITGLHTYTGGTTITGGILRVSVQNALPASGLVTLAPATPVGGAVLDLFNRNQTIGGLALGGEFNSNSTIDVGSAVLTLSGDVHYDAALNPGTATITGSLQLAGTGGRVFNIDDSSAADVELALQGIVADLGGGLIKQGAGTLALNNFNSYSGATQLDDGVVRIGAAAALGDGSATNTLAFDGGTLETLGSFHLGADRSLAVGAAGGTLSVAAGNYVHVDAAIAGPGAFHKTGSGTLIFDAAAAHAGGTDVQQGTLVLRAGANLSGTGPVTVASGGVLVGASAISGTVTVASGGTLSPGVDGAGEGDGVGTLTIASPGTAALFQGGGSLIFDFAQNSASLGGVGTDWDFLNLTTGSLALQADSVSNRIELVVRSMFDGSHLGINDPASLNPFNPVTGGNYSWLFAHAEGGIDLAGSNITDPGQIDQLFQIDSSGVFGTGLYTPVVGSEFWVSASGNNLYVNYGAGAPNAVPEPGSLVLIGVAGLGLFGYRRRNRRLAAADQPTVLTGASTI